MGKLDKKICYGSLYEIDRAELVRSGEIFRPINYISLWAQKMREKDPDCKIADALTEKYSQ